MRTSSHQTEIGKFLRKVTQDEVIEELQTEVFKTSYTMHTNISGLPPKMKLTQKHYKTILSNLDVAAQNVVWKDANDNGVAEISELASLSKPDFKQGLGLDLHEKNGSGKNAAVFSAMSGGDENLLIYLIQNNVDCSFILPDGSTILGYASAFGWLKASNLLIAQCKLPVEGAGGDYTPLFRAVYNKRINVTELLLKNGADVNINNTSGQTPIFTAIMNQDIKMIKLLLANGADVRHIDKYKTSVMMCAEQLKSMADPGGSSYKAIEETSEKIKAILLEAGAEPLKPKTK